MVAAAGPVLFPIRMKIQNEPITLNLNPLIPIDLSVFVKY